MLGLWLPVVAWCGLVFLGSAMPGDPNPATTWWRWFVFKGGHVVEYGVLFLLTRRALAGSGAARPGLGAFVFCVLYGASDEFHQSFVANRTAKASDVLIDSVGALLASRLKTRSSSFL